MYRVESIIDKLLRALQDLERAHPELATVDWPTQRVGATPRSEFDVVLGVTTIVEKEFLEPIHSTR